ncbi:MAG TPA: PAS domain S-box protein [Methylibium sp.]|nr:PAS domain S-box protein [Methylibium sp.]
MLSLLLPDDSTPPPPLSSAARWRAWRIALAWSIGYLVVAGVWVVGSSQVLARLPLTREQLSLAEAYKGLAFVAITAALLLIVVGRTRLSLTRQAARSRQQAEQLAMSVARWRLLMDNLSEVAWFASPDGREVLYVSPATQRVYGRSAQDFLDDPDLWMAVVHPDDRERLAASASALRHAGGLRSIEYRIRHADGGWRWLRDRASVLTSPAGEVVAVGGVAEDITGSKQASRALQDRELQLSGIVETAMDAIITVDVEQRIVVFNRAAAGIFRIDPADAIGTPLSRFIPLRQQQRHAEHVAGFARTGSTNRRMGAMDVLHGVRADGEEFPIEAAISRLGDGDAALMTVVLRDVTDARRAAAAIEAQRAAEAASRAKTEFLSRMSHELRTPLNAVLGFAQLLQGSGEPLSERQRVQIDHIRLAGWHLLALISDVLDVSRIEAGALQIAISACDADATAADAIELSRSLAERHGVRLHGPVRPADCSILADATRWRQILLNVLSNAIKYNRPGGEVSLSLEHRGDHLAVRVADSGLGMSAEQLGCLFEPFNRLGRQHGGIEGTGIGLTLTRELLLIMKGNIEVHSRVGEGTAVTLMMPVADLRAPQPDAPAPTAVEDDGVAAEVAPATVLYIEDNPVNVLIVEQLLSRWPQITLAQADDGASGIALAQRLAPDLILLDMRLPDMNGLDVLQRLKAGPVRASPVVALSASAMPDEVAAARAAGAIDYWTKPLDFDRFTGELEQLLRATTRPKV